MCRRAERNPHPWVAPNPVGVALMPLTFWKKLIDNSALRGARRSHRRHRRTTARPPRLEQLGERVAPSVTQAYVDDTWAGTALGADPANDPVGGLAFGTNAFADIQSAINALSSGGTLTVYSGRYPGPVNVNQSLA